MEIGEDNKTMIPIVQSYPLNEVLEYLDDLGLVNVSDACAITLCLLLPSLEGFDYKVASPNVGECCVSLEQETRNLEFKIRPGSSKIQVTAYLTDDINFTALDWVDIGEGIILWLNWLTCGIKQ